MREPKVCGEEIYQKAGKGSQGSPQRGLSHGIAGEGVYPNGENCGVPSKSIQWSPFPDGNTFLVGLCPTFLQLQVTMMLLAARHRHSNTAGTELLCHLVPGRLAMVDNTYYLKRPWKDN
jgi:hypothetical protein